MNEALKQGRLQEFNDHRVPRNFDSRSPVKHHLPELRMPLDDEFVENKRLARQVFEQELLDRQKETLEKHQLKDDAKKKQIL